MCTHDSVSANFSRENVWPEKRVLIDSGVFVLASGHACTGC